MTVTLQRLLWSSTLFHNIPFFTVISLQCHTDAGMALCHANSITVIIFLLKTIVHVHV